MKWLYTATIIGIAVVAASLIGVGVGHVVVRRRTVVGPDGVSRTATSEYGENENERRQAGTHEPQY